MPDDNSILDAAGGNAGGSPDNKGGSANADPNAGKPETGKPAAGAAAGSGKPDAGTAGDGGASKPNLKPEAGKPEGAPETYTTFKVPEGVVLEQAAVDKFNTVAKELNLSQAQAQRLVDFQTEAIKVAGENSMKEFEKMQESWKQETRKALGSNADKELGFAAKARDTFVSKEFRAVLNDSGLANHPEVIKFLVTIGKAISEDSFPEGKPGGGGKKSNAEILYGKK
jgi:hypothetical protein